ncbi:lysine N(6)-hydroxylase/L-ornithine N(5)-oxygenase family protein [Mangrovihabitans endophyticus]|uniref:L-lysine N6-monooxygenase MbtG n=1 Tax=Mangrovihabitans endophyticus TaxID=1751298 RepID=A0A8J3BVN3_9ACTN|nr:SidA/IucD/PvdA family monooxygenase [Mangrovihabitans endophyticus]GGK72656.1 lysine/ornithine N-monooxygenase [Mangrovihabitans endophyticus]
MGQISHGTETTFDVIGIGFGPANLALAVALDEYNRSVAPDQRLSYRFLERQATFGWHRGMLIEGTTMQISFLKDLSTMRNPTSDFGFVSYLHAQGRLAAFINHQCFFPSRVEFHDYLDWAAARLRHAVDYGREVVDVRPVAQEGDITELDVVVAGSADHWRARNLVLGTGLRPAAPAWVTTGDRVWHSENLLDRLRQTTLPAAPAFVVMGAGQSAAETVQCLHDRFPAGRIHWVFARYGLSPADDSPFVNAIFDPDAVGTFFDASAEVKEALLAYHRNTNYSVVDGDLIGELYRRHYQELVSGRPRLHLRRMSRVVAAHPDRDRVRLDIEYLPSSTVERVDADVLICATGYLPVDPAETLATTAALCKRDTEGRLRVGLDYRVETTGTMRCGIYLQGATEHLHGLSSSLLSNAAVRAGQIVSSLTGRDERRRHERAG